MKITINTQKSTDKFKLPFLVSNSFFIPFIPLKKFHLTTILTSAFQKEYANEWETRERRVFKENDRMTSWESHEVEGVNEKEKMRRYKKLRAIISTENG